MKTKLFFLIAMLFFIQLANAQRVGLKGGVNVANLEITPANNSSPEDFNLLHLGFVCDGPILGGIWYSTGLLYSEKGYKETVKSQNENTLLLGWDKFQYVEFPFNLQMKTLLGGKSYFFIQGGVYGAYALMGKAYWYGESGYIDFEKSGMNRYDYGVSAGAGFDFGGLILSVNYEKGLANLSQNMDQKIYNRVIQFSIAIMGGKK